MLGFIPLYPCTGKVFNLLNFPTNVAALYLENAGIHIPYGNVYAAYLIDVSLFPKHNYIPEYLTWFKQIMLTLNIGTVSY